MMGEKGTHVGNLLAVLAGSDEAARFAAARAILRRRLVLTRNTPIGCDYLFGGNAAELRSALKDLVEIEHRHGKELLFDYAPLNEYFILRIAGTDEKRGDIMRYFETD
jgi:hypothetical protein